MDRDEMSNLYRGPSIDASYQVSVHLAKRFLEEKIFDFLKSSPKPPSQINRNLVGNIYGSSSIKIAHFIPMHLQTWRPQAILVSDWPIFLNLPL
jgi:hypothetical protein